MSGLSGWLLCLVNLLVFSAISATRCLYYHCEVLALSLQGGLYYHKTWCLGPTTSGIVLARC